MRENYILLAIVIAILSCCCNQNLALGSPLSEENREYTITFVSDLPVEGWKELSDYRKCNSNNDCFLPIIKTYGYTFAGWEDEHGNLITNNKIPKNTVAQNIRLKAVWISNRNKFVYEPIKNPITLDDEKDNKFYWIYPVGRIENIPLKTIRSYGHHSKGESFTFNTTKSITFKNENAQAVSKNIQKKAINTSSVTATKNWNTTDTNIKSWNTTNTNTKNYNRINTVIDNWNAVKRDTRNWNITNTDTIEVGKSQTQEHEDNRNSSETDSQSHTITDENGGSNSTTNSTMNRNRRENNFSLRHSNDGSRTVVQGRPDLADTTTAARYKFQENGSGWNASITPGVEGTASEAGFGTVASASVGVSLGLGFGYNSYEKNGNYVGPTQRATQTDTNRYSNTSTLGGSNLTENMTTKSNTHTITWNHSDSITNARAVTNSQGTIDRISKTIDERRSHSTSSSQGGSNTLESSQGGSIGTTKSQGGSDTIKSSQGGSDGISETRGQSSRKTAVSTDEASTANGEVSTITYSEGMEVSKSESYKIDIKHPGNYREVVAGTAYIYKIVGYNLKTAKIFTFDHYVLDKEVHPFLDYSYDNASFNDCESVYDASFDIPFQVFSDIANKVCATNGLVVNPNIGSLEEYEGTSDTVLIPEYSCVPGETEEDGDVVKVTSLDSAYVFTANPTIKKVILSDFITEIPDRAFLNCTSLEYVWGGNIQKIGKEAFMNCKSLKSVPVSSITEIGNGAFSGCEALGKVEISSNIKSIGYKAFNSVKEVEATSDNAKIFDAIVYSGAKRISIKTDRLDANSLSGKYIYISKDTEYFYLGQKSRNKQFKNLTINSWAKESVFENIDLKSDACYNSKVWYDGSVNHTLNYDELWFNQRVYPLQLSSKDVKFYNVNIESKGVAILFDHDINLGLFGTSKIKSTNEYSIMSEKFINAYRAGESRSAVLLTNQKVGIGGNKDIIKLHALQHFFKKENNTSANIVFGVQLK